MHRININITQPNPELSIPICPLSFFMAASASSCEPNDISPSPESRPLESLSIDICIGIRGEKKSCMSLSVTENGRPLIRTACLGRLPVYLVSMEI